jgi:hypothetical protein
LAVSAEIPRMHQSNGNLGGKWRWITESRRQIPDTRGMRHEARLRPILKTVAVFLLSSTGVLGQTIPDSPSFTHDQFLDRPNIVLLSTLTAFQALDAYKTDRTLDEGGREMWPLARHFCQSREGRVGYFWATYAMTIGSSYFLHRTGHRKLARMVFIASSVSAASGFAYTLAHTR